MMQNSSLDSILRIGEVWSVDGRSVRIKVDENKNVSHLLYCGTVIKNVSVGGFVKISKGYVRIIAKVEGERIALDKDIDEVYHSGQDVLRRYLDVKLLGYIDCNKYYQGIKEMPLVGNECSLIVKTEFELIHSFVSDKSKAICIGSLLLDDEQNINFDINELFGSHIGIFGNTGSGKSYTLAKIYHQLFEKVQNYHSFSKNAKFLLFDFNGEYSGKNTITKEKTIFKLSTSVAVENTNRIPISQSEIAKPELLSILASATDKTQQPFIKRTLQLREYIQKADNALDAFRGLLKKAIRDTLKIEDGVKGNILLSYLCQMLEKNKEEHLDLHEGIGFHSGQHCFLVEVAGRMVYMHDAGSENILPNLPLYKSADDYNFSDNFIAEFIDYMYLQLILDVNSNRAINEHIAPAINKLRGTQKSFDKIFNITNDENDNLFDKSSFVVIDMNSCNTDMKKLVPLIISLEVYRKQKEKKAGAKESLNIIIDEAHNILSYESTRESETWKDYRLEVFEEIIKEGRKFAVFMTLASQRPSDISHTIISQLHNYFIHRLVNQRDIDMIANHVSYLDKLSVEQLPVLPQGGCVVAGVMTQLPVIIQVAPLNKEVAPNSSTIKLVESWMS
ncbi:ATP-binding protein [Hoylesella buccalis]|uniref:ATP-binding protein n=1 Tax=Hoylesella buccalis TaxID=28127 RepID=A0A2N6QNI8_9BACT|nr:MULTISPECIES: ATP-binding protein [Prevotellaceae]PMC23080.1 ATP-binding protein [Hoylesella buccalis]